MKQILSLCLIILSVSISAQRSINLNAYKTTAGTQRVAAVLPQEFSTIAKAVRTFVINPALQKENAVAVGDTVLLQLFEGKNFKSVVTDITTDINENFTLSLKLPDYSFATAFITTNKEGKSLLTLSVPELDLAVVSRSSTFSDTAYLLEIDTEKTALPEEEAIIPAEEEEIQPTTELEVERIDDEIHMRAATVDSFICKPTATPTDPAQIDILIVYTQAAEDWAAANEGGINNTLAAAMAHTREVVGNQGNGDEIRLVHAQKIDYTEQSTAMETDLRRVTSLTDEYMNEVHQLRKQYNADIVVLTGVYRNTAAGISWLMTSVNGRHQDAFNVVRVQDLGSSYCMAHEMGHTLGMQHGNGSATPLFPYAYGYSWVGDDGKGYRTILVSSYTGIPYYSNPDVIYKGKPAGTDKANNAQVFRQMKHVTAHYSDVVAHLTDAPQNVVVTNVTANRATFTWDAVPNATKYRVIAPNDITFYSTVNTSYTVSHASWMPDSCGTYPFAIQSINECSTLGKRYRSTFRIPCPDTDPAVQTSDATDISLSTATLHDTIITGLDPITEQGFKYRAIGSSGPWLTSTDGKVSNLSIGTGYQFYAYAKTAAGTFTGKILTFSTEACAESQQSVVYEVETYGGYTGGWNGAELVVKQNGATKQQITLTKTAKPSSSTKVKVPVLLCPCENIEFVWKTTSYIVEHASSFIIKNKSGETVFQSPKYDMNDRSSGCAKYANNEILFTSQTSCSEPLETVKIREIPANITHPTIDTDGAILFDKLSLTENTPLEVRLKPDYQNYRVFLLNESDIANSSQGTLWQEKGNYNFDVPTGETHWKGLFRVVLPMEPTSTEKPSAYNESDIVAQYALEIENSSTSGINSIAATPRKPIAFYNILGMELQQEPENGIYIIVYDNGTAEKVMR